VTRTEGNGGGLRLDGLSKRFGALTAVRELSLAIQPGEVYGLIGPNGSGKTTVKMLTGLYRPTAGRIVVDGVDLAVDSERAKRAMGYLPDEPFVYEKLSGRAWPCTRRSASWGSGASRSPAGCGSGCPRWACPAWPGSSAS